MDPVLYVESLRRVGRFFDRAHRARPAESHLSVRAAESDGVIRRGFKLNFPVGDVLGAKFSGYQVFRGQPGCRGERGNVLVTEWC